MEKKLHFKMFKAGKRWCVMGLATLALAFGLGAATVSANADAVSTTTPATQVTSSNTSTSQPAATQSHPTNQQSQADVDYQTPVNAGFLDGASADNNGNVVFSGWHATNQYQQGMYHFVIALNAANNQELYRAQVQTVNRPDVGRVYPKAPVVAFTLRCRQPISRVLIPCVSFPAIQTTLLATPRVVLISCSTL